MGKIFIFTGKGGVGKTSVAAAHARHSALSGHKTLIVSTDMAHNLGDLFQQPVGKSVTEITENLFALEIDPNYMMENDFKEIKNALFKIMQSSGIPLGDLAQTTIFPGMDELFSLLKIMSLYEEGIYDHIIVDCAPTGETLALLKFPELLSWYMEKLFPIGKVALRILSPISKAAFKIELPNKAALSDIETLFVRLIELQDLLKNRDITTIRLVAMPEKMVVEETKRSYMYLNLYGYLVDGLYINRILPQDIDNPFFLEWIAIQNEYVSELEMVFDNVPIYKIPWFDCDLNGLEGIDKIVEQVLQKEDVFSIHSDLESEQYEKNDKGYTLKLYLPCAEKGALQMHESTTDIIIKIGNFKRNLPKPSSLRNHTITAAKLDQQVLSITLTEQ